MQRFYSSTTLWNKSLQFNDIDYNSYKVEQFERSIFKKLIQRLTPPHAYAFLGWNDRLVSERSDLLELLVFEELKLRSSIVLIKTLRIMIFRYRRFKKISILYLNGFLLEEQPKFWGIRNHTCIILNETSRHS